MDHHPLSLAHGLAVLLCCLFSTISPAQDATEATDDTAPVEQVVDALSETPPTETPEPVEPPQPATAPKPDTVAYGLQWVSQVAALLGEDAQARAAAEMALAEGGAAALRALAPAFQRSDAAKDVLILRTMQQIAVHAGAPGHPPEEGAAVAEALLTLLESTPLSPVQATTPTPDPGVGLTGLLHAAAGWQAQAEAPTAPAPDASRLQARQAALLEITGLVAVQAQAARIEAFANQPALARAACDALARIPGAEVDAALTRLLSHTAPEVRMLAAAAIAQRGLVAQAGDLLQRAAGEDAAVAATLESAAAQLGRAPALTGDKGSTEALAATSRRVTLGLRAGQVLADQGDTSGAAHLLEQCVVNAVGWAQVRSGLHLLAACAPDEAARLAQAYLANAAVRQTALDVLTSAPSGALDERLAKAFDRADPIVQCGMLEVLAARGAAQTAKLASRALESEQPELRMVAAEITGIGANDDDLFAVAQRGSPWRRPVALRAFLDRAHAMAVTGAAEDAAARFRAVYEGPFEIDTLAEAVEALGACGIPGDLDTLEKARARSDLREPAFNGLVAYWTVQPDAAAAGTALKKLAMTAPSEAAAAHAAEALMQLGAGMADLPSRRGWITTWNVLGPVPWPEDAKITTPLFAEARGDLVESVAFEGTFYRWEPLQVTGMPAVADLSPRLTQGAQAPVLYASATLRLPYWTPSDLRAGVDGAYVVWVNGEIVQQRDTAKPFKLDEDAIAIRLRPGRNQIVLKMLPGAGPCRFAVRLTDRRGAPVDLATQRLPDDGLAGTGLHAPALSGNAGQDLP